MEKQKILLKINNQCVAVQISIAKNFEDFHNKELLFEISKLHALLGKFMCEKPKN